MNLSDMAKAHLGNVQAALNDLLSQKEKIESEIERLTKYMEEGKNLIVNSDTSVSESSSN